jgi:magnesium transporter
MNTNPLPDPLDEATDDEIDGGEVPHSEYQPVESDPTETPQTIANRIEEISPADGATEMENLQVDRAAEVSGILDPDTAGKILARMEPDAAASVITAMPAPEASMVLAAIDPDDRVDILAHVSEPLHDELMREFTPEDAAEVRRLEQYAPDTAGGIMTTQVTSLLESLTVEAAINELRRLQEELGQMFYVYVIDRRRHLVGVLSMRDLILSRPHMRLNQIMRPNVASVPATMDQEEVARISQKYKYLAMPVVDTRNRLIGLITVDDLVDVITEEATEDVQKMFGAGAEERLLSPWQFSFRKRVGWLEVNLATAFLAAWVVSWFDDVINALPILAAYQGIVSGMGGNAGAQALAVAIRGMALGENAPRLVLRVLYREFICGLLTGIAVGLATWICAAAGIFGRSMYVYHGKNQSMLFGLVMCLALTLNHINACVTGVLIPFVMKKLGFDPAQSATIFATTFTDCGGFFATLWLAKVIIGIH